VERQEEGAAVADCDPLFAEALRNHDIGTG